MVAKGFVGERVEFARFHVSRDLAIPCGGIKLGEPPPKLCEFLSRESGDSFLQGFEFTHGRKATTFSFRELTPFRSSPALGTSKSPASTRGWRIVDVENGKRRDHQCVSDLARSDQWLDLAERDDRNFSFFGTVGARLRAADRPHVRGKE